MAASISPELKLASKMNKPLLIRAIGEPLLVEAGKRQKKGFSFPLETWMKQFAGELEDMAFGANALDKRAVHHLWKAFRTKGSIGGGPGRWWPWERKDSEAICKY